MVLKCGIISMVGNDQHFLSGGLVRKVVRISYPSQFLEKAYVIEGCEGSMLLTYVSWAKGIMVFF